MTPRVPNALLDLSALLLLGAILHRPLSVEALTERAASGDRARGQLLWQQQCYACHGASTSGGPVLQRTLAAMLRDTGAPAARRYVCESIRFPWKVMRYGTDPMPSINLTDR